MRTHRIFAALALVLAGGLWEARDAAACEDGATYLGTGPQLPLGCPLHVYSLPGPFDSFAPTITVLRGGRYLNATGAIDQDIAQLTVERSVNSCSPTNFPPIRNIEPIPHFAIMPEDVSVGEAIGIGDTWLYGIQIVAAAPCAPPVQPVPSCVERGPCFFDQPVEDLDSVGCAAGGGAPGGLALVGLAALVRWAPRRRRR
jgi:MYXO-CTERM domain-containing protein